MTGDFLIQAGVFLAAGAIAAPIAKKLQVSSVLGYLAAGVLIGPYGLGFVFAVYQVESILHIAEFGVVLLLFLIGLELKPIRLWAMRGSIFGLGAGQVAVSAALITPLVTTFLNVPLDKAVFIALAMSLSSTALVLQVLDEKGELTKRHGRAAFSVLLFQDLAAIPLIALVPLLATGSGDDGFSWMAVGKVIGAILLVVVVGRYILSKVFQLIASAGVREAMTASALLLVVGVALLMEAAGLSAALGAFLAGALLADSSYRHQIEADIAPFEGLLLGLFFTAVGMGLNLRLLEQQPMLILVGVVCLLSIKATVLYGLGRLNGLDNRAARRLALAVSQGGEFAFVLFATALGERVIDSLLAELFTVIVTLSMLATPLLMLLDELLTKETKTEGRTFDELPEGQGHVVIAGFGRFGQIVARVLRARGIPFTALDESAGQVNFVDRFGSKAYYGDASRLDILEAAQVGKARAFVLAIDNVERSLTTVRLMRQHFPKIPVYARARDRRHTHQLMDLGVEVSQRDTFLSALGLTQDILRGLGFPEKEVQHTVETFRAFDERHLYEDYAHYTDIEKLQAHAKWRSEELEELFNQDVEDLGDGSVEEKKG